MTAVAPLPIPASRFALLTETRFVDGVLTHAGLCIIVAGAPGLRSSREVTREVEIACQAHPDVGLYTLDASSESPLSKLLRLSVLPTVVLFRGGAELGRLEGPRTALHYEIAIESARSAPAGAEL